MAVTYPLILNGVRFYVNPTQIGFNQRFLQSSINTEGGVVFQMWFKTPATLSIQGICAGETAFNELSFLQGEFELKGKLSELYYKASLYNGFIQNVKVDSAVNNLYRYPYTLDFQLLHGEEFRFQDFSLQTTSPIAGDYNIKIEEVNSVNKFMQKLNAGIYDFSVHPFTTTSPLKGIGLSI